MLLGQVFQSIEAWRKLSDINMKPRLAYKIYKYAKLVFAEYEIARKQQESILREVTGIKEGQINITQKSPEFPAYAERFNPVLQTESDLQQLDMDFEEVVDAVDDKEESLTVGDLALLEPFFKPDDGSFLNGEDDDE
jgi:hypothetical protein